MNAAPDSVELQPRRRGYAYEAQQPARAPASQKSGGSAAVPSEEPIMRFQSSDKRIPINAFQAQALIRSRAEDTTRMAKLSEHAPKERSAVLVLVEGYVTISGAWRWAVHSVWVEQKTVLQKPSLGSRGLFLTMNPVCAAMPPAAWHC